MDDLLKQQIRQQRQQGAGYTKIAESLGLNVNSVKSFCQRNNLGAEPVRVCEFCGGPLAVQSGVKKRRFCTSKCRSRWWANHPEASNRRAFYQFTCRTCQTGFTAYGNATRRYCTRACYGLSRKARV